MEEEKKIEEEVVEEITGLEVAGEVEEGDLVEDIKVLEENKEE